MTNEPQDWLEAELQDSLDEDYELELEDAALSREIKQIYRDTHPDQMDRRQYFKDLLHLQSELIKLQDWVSHYKEKVVVIFEGRDSAGKGGAIKRITQRLNPRVARVVALPAPSDREKTQWYFQRYITHLPAAGEIVLFDRSWYNRAGVEKVMGYCSETQYRQFLQQAPVFERGITDDGILLFKYWLCVDQALQEERFAERAEEPLKSWKLSPIDLKAREKYGDYTAAREAMLKATHTAHAPWTLVDFNDQRLGRLTLIRHLLDRLPDTEVPLELLGLPPLKGKLAKEKYTVVKPIPSFRAKAPRG